MYREVLPDHRVSPSGVGVVCSWVLGGLECLFGLVTAVPCEEPRTVFFGYKYQQRRKLYMRGLNLTAGLAGKKKKCRSLI